MIIPEMSAYLLEERAYKLIEDNLITLFNATVFCSEVLREGWGKKPEIHDKAMWYYVFSYCCVQSWWIR